MAITPFTKPVQQSKFIPGKRRLPIDAIAQATGQYVNRHVRNRDAIDQLESRLKQTVGDREELSPVMNRYRQRIEELAEDDLYADDTRAIKRLASEAQESIGLLQQDSEARQKQRELAESIDSVPRRRALTQAYLSSQQLGVTEDGRIDPSTVYQPKDIGEETDPFERIEEIASGLEEELTRNQQQQLVEYQRRYPNMNKIQLLRRVGVSPERIGSAARAAFQTDPGIQNRIQNRAQEILYQDDNIESIEDAREIARTELSSIINNASGVLSYNQYDTWTGTIPDRVEQTNGFENTNNDYDYPISYSASPIPASEYQEGSAPRETAESYQQNIINKAIRREIGEEQLQRIQELREEAEREAEEFSSGIQYEGAVSGPTLEENSRGSIFIDKLKEEGLYTDYRKMQTVGEEMRLPDIPTLMYTAPADNQTDLKKIRDVIGSIEPTQLSSAEIELAIEDDWIPATSNEEHMIDVLNNIDPSSSISMTKDGNFITLKLQDKDTLDSELRGRVIRLNLQDVQGSIRQRIAETIGGPQGEAIGNNIKWSNSRVRFDEPVSQGHLGHGDIELVGRTTENNQPYIEAINDGEYVTYEDSLPRGNMSAKEQTNRVFALSTSIQQRQPGNPLGNFNTLTRTLQSYGDNNPELSNDTIKKVSQEAGKNLNNEEALDYLRNVLEQNILSKRMRFTDRGSAMEFTTKNN